MGISKFNSRKGKIWNVDNSEFSYIKLRDLVEGKKYPFLGCFISSDNGYGEGAVLITADYNVNVPSRYVPVFRAMMDDNETIEQANNGEAYFYYVTFYSEKYKRPGYELIFEDK